MASLIPPTRRYLAFNGGKTLRFSRISTILSSLSNLRCHGKTGTSYLRTTFDDIIGRAEPQRANKPTFTLARVPKHARERSNFTHKWSPFSVKLSLFTVVFMRRIKLAEKGLFIKITLRTIFLLASARPFVVRIINST